MPDLPDAPQSILNSLEFEGKPVTLIELDGEVHVIAKEIGAALGYSSAGRKLINLISGDWSMRLRPDRHVVRLEGERLEKVKTALGSLNIDLSRITAQVDNESSNINSTGNAAQVDIKASPLDARAGSLLLLTERGLYKVLYLSHKPIAERFQDWLEDVLVSMRKTGSYTLPGRTPPPALPVPAAPMADRMTRFELGCDILKGVILHHRYDRAAVATRALALVDMMLSPPNQQLPNLHAMTRGLLDLLEDLYLRKALDRGRLVEYKLRITDRIAATGWSDAPRTRTEADDALREDFAAVQRLMARLARRKLLEDGKEQALCLYVVDRLAAGEQVTFGDLNLATEVLNWLTWLNTWGVINRTIYRERVQRLLDVLLPEQTALVRGGAP